MSNFYFIYIYIYIYYFDAFLNKKYFKNQPLSQFLKIFISIVEYSSLILFAFVFSKRNRKRMDFHSTSFQAGQAKGQAQVLVLHMFIIYYFLKQFLQA